jgi:photosystem II stability/assembly factor-like uncharacterized protein
LKLFSKASAISGDFSRLFKIKFKEKIKNKLLRGRKLLSTTKEKILKINLQNQMTKINKNKIKNNLEIFKNNIFSKSFKFVLIFSFVLISSFSLFSSQAFAVDGWTAHPDAGSNNWVSLAYSLDGVKIGAVAENGFIYTSTDSGLSWIQRTAAGSRRWKSIASSYDGNKLAAVDYNSYVYTSTDSGVTWTTQTGSGSRLWGYITSSSDGTKLAALASNGVCSNIYTSINSGVTWTERTSGVNCRRWNAIVSSSDGTKLAAIVYGNYVYTSIDSGVTWIARTSLGGLLGWNSISSSSDGTKLAVVAYNNYIYTSIDGGATWIQRNNDATRTWYSISSSSDGTKLVAAVNDGNIYKSIDSGLTWNADITAGLKKWTNVIYSPDGNKLGAINYNEYIYTYGVIPLPKVYTTYSSVDLTIVNLNGFVDTSNTTRGFEYGLTTGYGSTTTENGSFGPDAFTSSISSLIPETIYHYRAYATNSLGTSYSPDATFKILPFNNEVNAGTFNKRDVAASSDGVKIAIVGSPGYIYTSSNMGASWTQRTSDVERMWNSVTSSSDGTKLAAVVYNGYIYTSNDSGVTWIERTSAGSRSWQSIVSSSDGTKLYASDDTLNTGGIYISTDSGVTWVKSTGAGNRSFRSIASSPDGTKLIAGVGNWGGGYIYTSNDSGVTWTERTGAGYYYWNKVDLSDDGNTLIISGYNIGAEGSIYTSHDGGVTWTRRFWNNQYKSYSDVVSSSDGTKLAAFVYNGYIYTSFDGGITWTVQMSSGLSQWLSASISSNGNNIVAVTPSQVYTYNPSSSPYLQTKPASLVIQTSASFNGDILMTGGINPTVRGFEYGLTTSYGSTTTENGSFGIGLFSSSISSLPPNTTYHYRSYATNSLGTSYGEDVSFTTNPLLSPSLNISNSIILPTGVILNGTISDTGGLNPTTRGFEYGLTTSYGFTTIENGSFGTGIFSSTISSLTPDTTYHYRAYATNSVGTGYSADYTFVNTVPYNITVQQTGSGSRDWRSVTSSADGTKLAAVDYSGYIYTSVDSGVTWTERTGAGLRAWTFITSSADGNKLVALPFASGYIYTSADGGATWIERTTSGLRTWRSVASSSDGTKLAAVGSTGYISTSIDGGATWVNRTSTGSRPWTSIASSSDGVRLAAAYAIGYVYTSTDSGTTWTLRNNISGTSSLRLISITSSSDGLKLAVAVGGATYTGYIYTSRDGGVSWTRSDNAGFHNWLSISSSSDGTKLVAVSNLYNFGIGTGYFYISYDSGYTWIEKIGLGQRYWRSVASSADGSKIVLAENGGGNYGYIYTYTPPIVPIVTTVNPSLIGTTNATLEGTIVFDGGDDITGRGVQYGLDANYESGTEGEAGGSYNIGNYSTSIYYLSCETTYHYRVYAVSNAGHGYGDDKTFTTANCAVPTLTTSEVRTLSSSSVNLSASMSDTGGIGSTIRGFEYGLTTSYGSTTTENYISENGLFGTEPFSADISSLVPYTTYHYRAYSTNSVGTGYSDDGTFSIEWIPQASAGSRYWNSVASSSDGTKLAAVSGLNGPSYIYTSNDSGVTWIEQTSAGMHSWYSITSSIDGIKLAAVDVTGYVYTSTDGGINWTEQLGSGQRYWSSITSSSDGTKLAAVDYAGGYPGGYVYTSTDSGITWVERTSSGMHFWIKIKSSSDGNKLVAIPDIGYIYTSIDSGETWTEQTSSGSRQWTSVSSSLDGNKLVATVYDGYIYTSTDSGETWTPQINSSQLGWVASASSSDGTKLVAADDDYGNGGYIYISTDSGLSWVKQNSTKATYWKDLTSNSFGNKLIALESYGIDGNGGNIYTYSHDYPNTPPTFNPESSITATQVIDQADANFTKINISYNLKDSDTTVGKVNPNQVASTFEYSLDNGNWISIPTSDLGVDDTSLKNILADSYTTYSATWDVVKTIPNISSENLKVRITANDNETLNSTASENITTSVNTNIFELTLTSGLHGTVTPIGITKLLQHQSQTYTITPDAGFEVGTLIVDGVSLAPATTYTFTNVIAPHTIDVTFKDIGGPVITLNGADPISLTRGDVYVEQGATALDEIDGERPVTISGIVVPSVVGAYPVTYTATDTRGNISTKTRTVNVILSETYNITATSGLNGTITPSGITAVPTNGEQIYTITPDEGFKVETLTVDGVSLAPAQIHTFTNVIASHTIEATFIDIAGPIITLNGADPMSLTKGNPYVELGATASDSVSGDLVVTTTGSVNSDVLGTYTITYSATDTLLNTSTKTRTVNVVLSETYDITATSGLGGTVTPSGITAVPSSSEQIYTITPNEGFKVGSITIDSYPSLLPSEGVNTYTFKNVIKAHTISATFIDISSPVVTLNGDDPMSVVKDTIYTEPGATALDAIDGVRTVTVSGSVNTSVLGAYQVTYTATDTLGNIGTKIRTVNVILAEKYDITATSGLGGTITPTGITSVISGQNQTYTVTPNQGYAVETLTVDGVKLAINTTHTFTNVIAPHTISVTFIDISPLVISISPTTLSGLESVTPATATINFSRAFPTDTTVSYTISGTATEGIDYTLVNGTATILAGQTSSNIEIPIINDTLKELDETVVITLSNPSNGSLSSEKTFTYTITDDDIPSGLEFTSSGSSGAESVTSVLIPLTLAEVSGADTTVDYTVTGTATSGIDYTLVNGTATIRAGETSTNISLSVVNDILKEDDETVIITLSNPVNANLGNNLIYTYIITDDDLFPTLAFNSITSENKEDINTVNIPVSISIPYAEDVTFSYTVTSGTAEGNGVDYLLPNGTATILAGETSTNIPLVIYDDNLSEETETIVVTISNGVNAILGANSIHAYSILDNEIAVTAISGSEIKATSARIVWTTADYTDSLVEYGTIAPPGTETELPYTLSKTNPEKTLEHNVYLGNLTPLTKYYFRTTSTNIAGEVTVSLSEFTTTDGPITNLVNSLDVTDTTATVTWTTNIPSTSYVNYGTDENLLKKTRTGTDELVIEHSVALTNLSSDVVNYFYVEDTDTNGNNGEDANNGSYYTFKTLADQTAPVISEISTPVLTSNQAAIVWNTNEVADGKIKYGIASTVYTNESELISTPLTSHLVAISELTEQTQYFYIVVSADANGNTSTSEEQTFTTPAKDVVIRSVGGGGIMGVAQELYDVLLAENEANKARLINFDENIPVISNVQISNITAFGATITFETSEDTIAFINYGKDISFGKSEADSNWSKSHIIKINGLNLGTEYFFQIKVMDKSNDLGYSDNQTFTTKFLTEDLAELKNIDNIEQFQAEIESTIESILPSLVPPFIDKPVVSDITENSAVITFRTNIKSYPVVSYTPDSLYNATKENPYDGEMSDTSGKNVAHTLSLIGLKPNTKYHFMVKAFSLPQVIGKSGDFTFITAASKIRGSVIDIKKDSFTVVWTTDEPTSSIVEYKNLKTGRVSRIVDEAKNSSHSNKIENLSPGTNYEINISGINAKGNIVEGGSTLTVKTSTDNVPPVISNIKVESALVVGRADKVQTIISWQTDEPATSTVYFEEGSGSSSKSLANKKEDVEFTKNHVVVLSSLKAGTVYRFTVESMDGANNMSKPPIRTIITPKKTESIVDVIFKNFDDTFNFVNNVR